MRACRLISTRGYHPATRRTRTNWTRARPSDHRSMRSPKSPAPNGPKSPRTRAFDRHVPGALRYPSLCRLVLRGLSAAPRILVSHPLLSVLCCEHGLILNLVRLLSSFFLCSFPCAGSGLRGLPKKGGAGGKGTWGGIMTADGPAAVDTHDPNYDSDGGNFSLDPLPGGTPRQAVAHVSVSAAKTTEEPEKVEKAPSLASESGAST